jgi:hypothetical protein
MKLSNSMSLCALIICLLGLLFVPPLDAQSAYDGPVWHVAINGSDSTGDGSAIYPFATFQKAVDMSNDYDTILVLPGIYSGEGNYLINISNKNSLVVMSQDGPLETILDLTPDSIYYRGFDIIADDSSYNVVIDGFSIRFGNSYKVMGTAIRIERATVSIRDCRFEYNSKSAVYIKQANVTISNCLFLANALYFGGAIQCLEASLDLDGCTFAKNKATLGGSIHTNLSTLTVSNCTFSEDSAETGSALYLQNTFASIENSVFAFGKDGEAMWYDTASIPKIICSDIYGYDGGDWIGPIAEQLGLNGNFSLNPLFCDTTSFDYQLTTNSPCAPDNNNCKQQIGAHGIGCGPWEIQLRESEIYFNAFKGEPNPDSEIEITNSGGGNLHWAATNTYSWLEVAPSQGTAPGYMTVTARIDLIPEGLYADTIVIVSEYAINSPQLITVDLNLECINTIVLDTNILEFQMMVGDSSPPGQTFTINNLCLDTLAWTLAYSSNWLIVTPLEGLTPAIVSADVNPESIDPGTYYDTIYIFADIENSPQILPVQFTLSYINRPPYFDPLPADTQITEGDLLELNVYTHDPDGDPLVCSCFSKPENAVFTCNENGVGLFSFTPDYMDVDSSYLLGFLAEDSSGLQALDSMTLSIVNRQLEVEGVDPEPPEDAFDILIDDEIAIIFNEGLNEASIPANVNIHSARGGEFIYGYSPISYVLYFESDSDYMETLDTITIRLEPGLRDLAGYTLGIPFEDTIYTGVGVFPGDANNDGCVNEQDILPLGIYWEMTGPPRYSVGLGWWLRPAHVWAALLAAYADCDGSGIIDSADVCGITDNWGRLQSEEPSFKTNATKISDFTIQIDPEILWKIYNGLCACSESQGKETLRQTLEILLNSGNDPLPHATTLSQNYPNPFNLSTAFTYSIDKECRVEVDVYDIRGRKVINLVNELKQPGHYIANWDGTDSDGSAMPSGIYFYRLKTGQTTQARKMLLLK